MKKFKRMSMQISLIIKFFIALLIMNAFVYSVMKVEDIHYLYGTHDEANICVAFHAVHIEQLNPGNTVIRCNDTDILIIMLSNIQRFSQSHVWLDMGLDYNNSSPSSMSKEQLTN